MSLLHVIFFVIMFRVVTTFGVAIVDGVVTFVVVQLYIVSHWPSVHVASLRFVILLLVVLVNLAGIGLESVLFWSTALL